MVKMENNKEYYTPDIEDLHYNYECEINFPNEDDVWVPTKLDNSDIYHLIEDFNNSLGLRQIRTSFLDKQDVESLRWEFNILGKKDWFKGHIHPNTPYDELHYPFELWFKLDNYWLGFYRYIHKVVIIEEGNFPNGEIIRYTGKCLSINELVKLHKMLNIPIDGK